MSQHGTRRGARDWEQPGDRFRLEHRFGWTRVERGSQWRDCEAGVQRWKIPSWGPAEGDRGPCQGAWQLDRGQDPSL